MTAKEYLNQAYWLDRRIDSKLEQLSALKDMATKTTISANKKYEKMACFSCRRVL